MREMVAWHVRTCARVGSRLCLSENEGECYAESCCRSVCLDQPVRSERVSLESFGRVLVVVCVCGHRTECELCVCVWVLFASTSVEVLCDGW